VESFQKLASPSQSFIFEKKNSQKTAKTDHENYGQNIKSRFYIKFEQQEILFEDDILVRLLIHDTRPFISSKKIKYNDGKFNFSPREKILSRYYSDINCPRVSRKNSDSSKSKDHEEQTIVIIVCDE
jgi:hypothetical protein